MRTMLAGLMGVMIATGALAQTGSNIGLTDYPGPSCAKLQMPVPPGPPPGMDEGAAAVDGYNAKVRQFNNAVTGYNQAAADFSACMKTYVDNGNADMARIKQRLDLAVTQANMP